MRSSKQQQQPSTLEIASDLRPGGLEAKYSPAFCDVSACCVCVWRDELPADWRLARRAPQAARAFLKRAVTDGRFWTLYRLDEVGGRASEQGPLDLPLQEKSH